MSRYTIRSISKLVRFHLQIFSWPSLKSIVGRRSLSVVDNRSRAFVYQAK